jgi:hypothetical protein
VRIANSHGWEEGKAVEVTTRSFVTKKATESKPFPDYMAYKFIALRAYEYWERRGRPFGSPDCDWFQSISDINREMTSASGSKA